MRYRVLFLALAVVGLMLASLGDAAQAGRFSSRRYSAPRCRPVAQTYYSSYGWKRTNSPGITRVDGKTLWDLGKQNGSWPVLP